MIGLLKARPTCLWLKGYGNPLLNGDFCFSKILSYFLQQVLADDGSPALDHYQKTFGSERGRFATNFMNALMVMNLGLVSLSLLAVQRNGVFQNVVGNRSRLSPWKFNLE